MLKVSMELHWYSTYKSLYSLLASLPSWCWSIQNTCLYINKDDIALRGCKIIILCRVFHGLYLRKLLTAKYNNTNRIILIGVNHSSLPFPPSLRILPGCPVRTYRRHFEVRDPIWVCYLNSLWWDKNISLETKKKRLGKAVIESVACNGCEV